MIEITVVISTYEVSVPPAMQTRILATPTAVITHVFKGYIKRLQGYQKQVTS
jgi:hypothetical protein